MNKTAMTSGADNKTPSIPQYFSWINSTNEGSTESQTLINLDFFRWLKDEYGMEIKIYAWDAGNYDGAADGFGNVNSPKFKSQYPNGYKPIAEKAASIGARMGLWGSPDGFGETPEEEAARYEFILSLCRDFHFALFKIDGVCGNLRPEKADVYAQLLQDCRKYSPDLVVLNHRLELYSANQYVTTSLWNGEETYIDVFGVNRHTCMHNRGYMFHRGLPENMERLLEDHGVCISSSIDYFEDDLIYQAFNRCMILAPEIYGNPWLMRDDEYPKLARIYNLHKRHGKILVDGMPLPEGYGNYAVARGSETHRFIATGNSSWVKKSVDVKLDGEIGLNCEGKVAVVQRHPSEKLIGIYNFGDTVSVELMPFRATLLEIAPLNEIDPVLVDCDYEVIKEKDGRPVEIKMLRFDGGEAYILENGEKTAFGQFEPVDILEKSPMKLGTLKEDKDALCKGEELHEVAAFAADNDSLELRSLKRSGETKIPEVQAARDAFFGQDTYKYRGCENCAAFDGREDTFFDGVSRTYQNRGTRVDGGCLRVDLGAEYDVDTVEITCFATKEPIFKTIAEQIFTEKGDYSSDLKSWTESSLSAVRVDKEDFALPVVIHNVHNVVDNKGSVKTAVYSIGGKMRYFRLAEPMDRIFAIKAFKDGKEIKLEAPTVNNLQPHYSKRKTVAVKSETFTLPTVDERKFIAVALEGEHGLEGAYCVAEVDGVLYGTPERANAFVANQWEHRVDNVDKNCTYRFAMNSDWSGKEIKIYTVFGVEGKTDVECDVYLCDRH